jgi:DNA-binding CsgD family transcriptional regulator
MVSWTRSIRASLASWRRYQDGLRMLRKMAEQKPAATALAFELIAEELRQKALEDLFYFGVASPQARYTRRLEKLEDSKAQAEKEARFYETYYHDRKRYEKLASQGFFDLPKEREELLRKGPSQNFDEEIGSTLAAMQHTTYKFARHNLSIAGEESRAAGQGYYGPAICDAFLEVIEQAPVIFAGVVQQKWGGNPRTRQGAAAALTGWVGSRISLHINPRLKTALGNVQGSTAFEQIVQRLSGAVVIEWATLERREPLSVLVRRTALHLEKEGDQASRLNQKGKLAAGEPEEGFGTDEPDLEEFRLREELRALKDAAKLSEQEHQILELALGEQPDRVIAEKLNLKVNSVKTVKKRARRKLKQAAE